MPDNQIIIRLAREEDTAELRDMWKICFCDSDAFIELHFTRKYKPENTLILLCGDRIAACLHMLPCFIILYGRKFLFYYLAGLCTRPEFRARGFMGRLVEEAHKEMQKRGIPLSILIPAEKTLYTYYERLGYQQISEESEEIFPLAELLKKHPDFEDAYRIFNKDFQQNDFSIRKSLEDFHTVVEDFKQDPYPRKKNLASMARIIDPEFLFSLYRRHSKQEIKLSLTSQGKKWKLQNGVLEVDLPTLCRLLLGFKTNEMGREIRTLFPERKLIMNLMLE